MAASENRARIIAANLAPPPSWALLQRQLMALMEEAALYSADRYNRPDGTPLNVQDADDAYEAHSYRGLFYALGGGGAMRAAVVSTVCGAATTAVPPVVLVPGAPTRLAKSSALSAGAGSWLLIRAHKPKRSICNQ